MCTLHYIFSKSAVCLSANETLKVSANLIIAPTRSAIEMYKIHNELALDIMCEIFPQHNLINLE